jgi:hypothetical protein
MISGKIIYTAAESKQTVRDLRFFAPSPLGTFLTSLLVFLLSMQKILTTIKEWMSSSRVVRASDCHCRSRNSPGLDPIILRNSGI